jgi:DNA-directed RNA polymerase subunit M/transcription elongation factor TFIIS
MLPTQTTPIQLGDPNAEKDSDMIADIIQKCYKGDIGKPYAIKEIAKIFHKYYEEDKKHQDGEGEGEGDPSCPKCGENDWEVTDVVEQDANGNPTKIRVRCKKCGYTTEVKVNPYGSGALRPNKTAHGIKIKWAKEDIDKIMEGSKGADRNDLGEIGIDLSKEDYVEAMQRAKIRRFIKEHVVVAKDKLMKEGEEFRVSTDVWQMGDSLLDINIPSSELASLGIDDLRMIPTVTLKKNVYVTTKGTDYEKLKGVKYFGFLDVSGSMEGVPERKALAMLREVWECSKKLDFDFHLCLFSTRAKRIAQADLKRFFEDENFRRSNGNLGGGTQLSEGLKQFDEVEYKDANIVVISDCDIGDVTETKDQMLKIAQTTNSFKMIIIRESDRINDDEIKRLQEEWFPNKEVRVLGVSTNDDDFSYEH